MLPEIVNKASQPWNMSYVLLTARQVAKTGFSKPILPYQVRIDAFLLNNQ